MTLPIPAWSAPTLIIVVAVFCLAGCRGGECQNDNDCMEGQVCIDGGGVLFGASHCQSVPTDLHPIADAGNDVAPTQPDTTSSNHAHPDGSVEDVDTNDIPHADTGTEERPVPSCDDNPSPERCSIPPNEFDDWGPSSHIDQLAIADGSCCVDFTGDGTPNNGVFDLITSAIVDQDLEELNTSLQESIDESDANLVFEFEGLLAIDGDQNFDIHVLISESFDPDGVWIAPSSFSSGAFPRSILPNSETSDMGNSNFRITGGPASMPVPMNLVSVFADADMGVSYDLLLQEADLEATLVTSLSSVSDGITMMEGTLGGLVIAEDLVDGFNQFAANCHCLDYPEEFLVYEEESTSCGLSGDTGEYEDACAQSGEELCEDFARYCPLASAIDAFADIDSSGSGVDDAFSIGLHFAGSSIRILGVSPDPN